MNTFLRNPPPFLFFTGKGGVGKTTLASASAIALADSGKRVLLVSTDPASNLDEVLNTKLNNAPKSIDSVPGLSAMNIDPNQAAEDYRERIVSPIRGVLPEATVKNIEEQLSGACTTEIASFNEFSKMIGTPEEIEKFDSIILDTAPTGHTLRLLALPAAWNDFIAENKTGSTCLGPLSGLKNQQETYQQALQNLQDPEKTTLVLVARSDKASLKEASRASNELRSLKIENQQLVLNAVFKSELSDDPVANAMKAKAIEALDTLPQNLKAIPLHKTYYHISSLSGIERLREFLNEDTVQSSPTTIHKLNRSYPKTSELIEEISNSGKGVIMTMGKGGVGKTTLAKKIAMQLAKKGHKVHLSTTDPADHISDMSTKALPNLSVKAIDPAETTRLHVENTLKANANNLDKDGLELLKEELLSPCTEEIAVFAAFAEEIAKGKDHFVVIDTAPTGHTLLLLDTTEAYHRELSKSSGSTSDSTQTLLPRLRDPSYTKVIIATLPEATPVHEAASLQTDLRRADIEPYAWVINQSLATSVTKDPLLLGKASQEEKFIDEVAQHHTKNWSVEPWSHS